MDKKGLLEELKGNVNKYFVGKEDVVEKVIICLLAGGHVLIEDVPGLGKTTLASVVSKSIQSSFGRIQCTPDTLPSDITGVTVYQQHTGKFEFCEGVVMNQILLVDEINRATPKTQSSLLEAMAEQQVTVDGVIHKLPELFMVIATQNPSEYIGTYPLPEAQMDRFMMRLTIGYPVKEQELQIARNLLDGTIATNAGAICTAEDIVDIRKEVEQVHVSDSVLSYMVDIVRATREDEHYTQGASPRAMLALLRAAQAKGYIEGRDFVKPDDVKSVAKSVLLHRLAIASLVKGQKDEASRIFDSVISKVRVPV